jgi:integrase
MQLTPLASHVIPVTSSVPNHHTHTRIRVTNACRDQGSPIATRIPPNTGFAKTRHSAAWRMAQDPQMPITDVQWILAHASLATTQLYTTPDQHEVIVNTRAHYQRRASKPAQTPPPPAPGYNPESLRTLFGDPS